jgi:beta-glucosidase
VGVRRLWVGTALFACALGSFARASDTDAEPFSPRVRTLVAAMTLDEKLSMVQGSRDPAYGGGAGYLAGVARLGVPPLRFADGPANVFNRYPATALPQPIALAATFSPDLARRYGETLGREARATRTDVLLAPMVNIMRLPNWGRNVTSFGEDPLVIAQLASAEVGGIQSTGTLANAKHFIANNQALHQGGGIGGAPGHDFIVDERTLHEIYLPGFEATLHAGVASVMAAYNKTNGFWNAENASNLTGLLRQELHWDGFVVSDWHANRSTPSIVAGLDVEMPGAGPQYPTGVEGPKWGTKLGAAISSGQIPMSALDRAVGHVLHEMERLGFLDGTRVAASETIDVEANAAFARELASQGAVLLKNEGGILPLKPETLGDVLLIGPTAGQLAVGPGVSGFEERFVSPLAALREAVGTKAKIDYVVGDDLTGVAIPASALTPEAGSGSGLTRHPLEGLPTSVDAVVDFTAARALPLGRGYVWRGKLSVPATGTYSIQIQSWDGSGTLKIDGKPRAYSAAVRFGHGIPRKGSSVVPTTDGLDNAGVSLELASGKSYAIEVEGQALPNSKLQIRLAWVTPQMRKDNLAAAVQAARGARTVVVFAWARSGEFDDPDLALRLPNDQDALIDAVARANANTIVVLNSSSPHDMPWLPRVKAVLDVWFAGQEGGRACADLLLGTAVPGGKLPFTFPKRARDSAALDAAHPERYDGVDGRVVYSEGIFTGYRHYDARGIAPLYPFGYGLSYTTFAYSDLHVRPEQGGLLVTFKLRNTGSRRAAEVAQVYLGAPANPPVPMAKKALAGFARVDLEPGESREVTVRVGERQMSFWSVQEHAWKRALGARAVLVGGSSADIKLRGRAEAK